MKPYAIFDSEFKSISRNTSGATACFSAFAGLIGYSLNLIKDVFVSSHMTLEMQAMATMLLPVLLALSVVFLIGGFMFNHWRNQTETIIRSESGEEPPVGIFGRRKREPEANDR